MLSIIIPVLNEATTIQKLLLYLREYISGANPFEILIVDGGSNDATVAKVEEIQTEYPDLPLHIISSKKGRARQMNAGAAEASGTVLYFLHADSFPPKHFDQLIIDEINRGNSAGCFCMRFDNNHWWLQLAGWLTRFNWKVARGGDQSLFINAQLFEDIGGYDAGYAIYEDNVLISELYKRKNFVVIPKQITTSARLYEELGVFYVQYHFFVIHLKNRMGTKPEKLANYYIKHLKTGE